MSIFSFFFGAKVWSGGFFGIGAKWDLTSTLIFVGCMLIIAAAAYLLGSVNTAIILTRFVYKDDIRQKGSGNPGMTNVMRTYGWLPAVITLFGDMLKCMLGMMVGTCVFGITGAYIAGLCGILGHVAPVFYKFRGGKGVASMFMVMLYVDTVAFLILGVLFVLIVWATKYLSLGSVMAALIMPLMLNKFDFYGGYTFIRLMVAFVIMGIVVYKHRENIKRIMNKTESKFAFKKTKRKADFVQEEQVKELTPEDIARKEMNRKKSAKKKK